VWSATGAVGQCFDPLLEWRQAVDDTQPVTGEAWPCGHYIPEEMPEQLAQDMINFFSAGSAA
jgi:haloacetate dehalogenase